MHAKLLILTMPNAQSNDKRHPRPVLLCVYSDIHNVFGYYYHLATADALIHRGEVLNGADGDRPFVLSRAFFSGVLGMWGVPAAEHPLYQLS